MKSVQTNLVTGEHTCKFHNHSHKYVKHVVCGHEYCGDSWLYCPRCAGRNEENHIARNSSVDAMDISGSEVLAHAINHNFDMFAQAAGEVEMQGRIQAHRLMDTIDREFSRDAIQNIAKNWMDVCRTNYTKRSA